jgi:hypothetical protein
MAETIDTLRATGWSSRSRPNQSAVVTVAVAPTMGERIDREQISTGRKVEQLRTGTARNMEATQRIHHCPHEHAKRTYALFIAWVVYMACITWQQIVPSIGRSQMRQRQNGFQVDCGVNFK